MAKTVIYGGTFNPLHVGHIEIIKLLCEQDFTKKLIVIPTALPPHKSYDSDVEAIHRLNMCKLATKGMDKAVVSDIELVRQGKSYTIDTVNALYELGEKNIAVACGGDMLVTLDTWKNYKELISKVEIVAMYRVGTDKDSFDEAVKKTIADGGNVTVVNADITDVASKDLRLMLKSGKDVSNFITAEIYDYIKQNRLYV